MPYVWMYVKITMDFFLWGRRTSCSSRSSLKPRRQRLRPRQRVPRPTTSMSSLRTRRHDTTMMRRPLTWQPCRLRQRTRRPLGRCRCQSGRAMDRLLPGSGIRLEVKGLQWHQHTVMRLGISRYLAVICIQQVHTSYFWNEQSQHSVSPVTTLK